MDVAVQNAADPKQVKKADRREKRALTEFEDALFAVMRTYQGRQFIWELLGKCKVTSTVFAAEACQMAYNAGRQDVGHDLWRWVEPLDDGRPFLQMQAEGAQRARRTNSEIAVAAQQGREVSED